MTNQELLALIQNDITAKNFFETKQDVLCAERCSAIAPKVRIERTLTERGVLRELGAVAGDAFLKKLEDFSKSTNPLASVAARAVKLLEPNNGGLDFGNTDFLGMVLLLTQAQVFTSQESAAIESLSLVPQIIDPLQVEYVRTRM